MPIWSKHPHFWIGELRPLGGQRPAQGQTRTTRLEFLFDMAAEDELLVLPVGRRSRASPSGRLRRGIGLGSMPLLTMGQM